MDRYSTDILKIQKIFGLITLMGVIYTPNILKYSFIDSLYDTPTFQKLWHVIDFIYFRNFYTSMAKQTPAMIPMMGKEAVVTKFTFLYMKLCHKLYYPKKQLSVGKSFALLKCQLHFKQYIKTKRACFEIKLYKLTSSNGTTLIFSVNSRKRMFQMGVRIGMSPAEGAPFHQLFLFCYW